MMSLGKTASSPYTKKKCVYPIDLFGMVLKLQRTEGNPSAKLNPRGVGEPQALG
jgi:hypothetical protein